MLNKIILISNEEKILFIEAVFFLFFSKLFLFLPFKYCIKRFDSNAVLSQKGDPIFLRKVQLAISRANKLAFWKNICLVKSFGARFMLQRRNISSVMYLGLQFTDEKELVAHAWLIANEVYITPKGRTEHKEIFSF
ncbi:MAG: hypothetical protein ACI9L6_001198 [Flavobacterium sp.]